MTFVERLDKAGLVGLEDAFRLKHPLRSELVEADERVDARVAQLDRETFTLLPRADIVEMGRKLARGDLKPRTVAERLSSAACKPGLDGKSRRSFVLEGARAQLVADTDKPEWSSKALKTAYAVALKKHLNQYVSDLQAAIAEAPESVREAIYAENAIGLPLTKIDTNELSPNEFTAFSRLREVTAGCYKSGNVEWTRFRSEADSTLFGLVSAADVFAGRGPELYDHFGRLRPGQPEEFVDALLWSDSAELIGAGYSVDQAVKDPNSPIHLDVIVDPAGVDKDEYERRLAKYKNVYYFRHELEFLRRQNMAVDNRTANELKRRATMPADELLALMGKKKAVRTGGNAS